MKKTSLNMLLLLMFLASTTGCVRPYPKPIVEEIGSNETAFLVPLEGDTGTQAKFDSAEQLNKMKVAAKRITIPVTWLKTGRFHANGKWIPNARLIKVDRTPVATRELKLSAESKDSVGVTSQFAITAYVKEADTARYLYWFPGKDLKAIVVNQILNSCQAVYARECARWEVRELRLHKDEISDAIRDAVIPEFETYGITINPTMGLIGGLVYDNPKIQEAIDTVFIAQTMEAKREADRVAQIKQNELDLSVERNEAEKRKVKADAEAYEITSKAKAIADGGAQYLELLRLEVDKARIAKWNGSVPMVQSGGDGASTVVPVVLPQQ